MDGEMMNLEEDLEGEKKKVKEALK